MGPIGIGRSMVHLHVYMRNFHDADAAYQCFQDFASSITFGEQGMGLLPATLGIGSDWTRWRLLRHLLPLYPAPAAWRLSQLAPRLTKSDDDPTLWLFVILGDMVWSQAEPP
jgi:hypothetical protein